MSDECNLIDATKAGLRASATLVPPLAPLIQVWNEHEAIELSRRVERFWQAFVNEAQLNGRRFEALENSVEYVAESVQLLQAALHSARGQSVEDKQEMLGKAAASMIAAGTALTRDGKLSIIDALDSLTARDIEWLKSFAGGQRVKVATLSRYLNDEKMGSLVLSLTKLESRGLIGQTDRPSVDTNAWTGSAERWDNQWRQRYYQLLPAGTQLLKAIGDAEG